MSFDLRNIESVRSPEFKEASQLAHQRGREKRGAFLIEGDSMIGAALEARAPLLQAFVVGAEARVHPLTGALIESGVETFALTKGLLFKLLGTSYETSTWCVAVVRIQEPSLKEVAARGSELLVLGESIQDPRNVGVMIRTAEAVGAGGFLLTRNSADPFSRAAVRSTTGAIFRIPLVSIGNVADVMPVLKNADYRLVGTSANAEPSLWERHLPQKAALVFGNETTGLSEQARAACDDLVRIPMFGKGRSLNVTVAMGIVLYEWRKQLLMRP